ncbi:MAG: hypothetical protein IPK72_19360 [Candidatus Eisenbacteria bacterium]|nr:hypothetical protein [Candidatus Eisenbacteria bacterium]
MGAARLDLAGVVQVPLVGVVGIVWWAGGFEQVIALDCLDPWLALQKREGVADSSPWGEPGEIEIA